MMKQAVVASWEGRVVSHLQTQVHARTPRNSLAAEGNQAAAEQHEPGLHEFDLGAAPMEEGESTVAHCRQQEAVLVEVESTVAHGWQQEVVLGEEVENTAAAVSLFAPVWLT
jgi:hypothetical protein